MVVDVGVPAKKLLVGCFFKGWVVGGARESVDRPVSGNMWAVYRLNAQGKTENVTPLKAGVDVISSGQSKLTR